MKNRECKTKQVKPSESVNVNELTLLGAVERVVEMAENSALSEQFFNNARPYVSFIRFKSFIFSAIFIASNAKLIIIH